MDSEAHTGSTEERSAVDGEEDGDPMLDCEWQGQYQRSLGEEGVFGRTILFRHADAGGQCEGYHWNNLHTMVSKDAKSAKMYVINVDLRCRTEKCPKPNMEISPSVTKPSC